MKNNQLKREDFVVRAIKTLADPKYGKGIPITITGFCGAFFEYYGESCVETLDSLEEKGVIVKKWKKFKRESANGKKGDNWIYMKEDYVPSNTRAKDALHQILADSVEI